MASRFPVRMLSTLLLLGGCSDAPVESNVDDASTSDGDGSTTGGDTAPQGSTADGEESSSSSSSDVGDDTSSESTGSTGDEPTAPPSFDLVVQRDISGDEHLFAFRVVEGVSEPLVRLHELDAGRDWSSPLFLSGGRVLMEVDGPGGSELHIADLANPSHTERLDVATEPAGFEDGPVVLPNESLLYGNDGFMNRVRLEGTSPSETDVLVPYGGYFRIAVDPLSRYVMLEASDSTSAQRLALDDLSVDTLPDSGFVPHLTADGSAGFRGRNADGTWRVEYVPLGDGIGTPIDLLPGVMPDQVADYLPSLDGVRPHPTAHGVAVTVRTSEDETTLHYVGIEDGVALPPILLDGPEVSGELHGPFSDSGWSPDGRWLGFEVYTDAGYETWIADFGDGHEPELTLISPAGPEWWADFYWAPDSSALHIGHGAGPGTPPRAERVLLTGDEPIVQPIGEDRTHPLALSPDGSTLAYIQWDGDSPVDGRALYLVDVSGPELGEPTLLADGLSGDLVERPAFSPDGRVVAYGRIDEGLQLMLASLDEPETAHVQLTEALEWWFAPSR